MKRDQWKYNGFFAISSFPKVIGAINGTHINIPAPHKNPECYVNREGHYSIQLQVFLLSIILISSYVNVELISFSFFYKCRFLHIYIRYLIGIFFINFDQI